MFPLSGCINFFTGVCMESPKSRKFFLYELTVISRHSSKTPLPFLRLVRYSLKFNTVRTSNWSLFCIPVLLSAYRDTMVLCTIFFLALIREEGKEKALFNTQFTKQSWGFKHAVNNTAYLHFK